VYEETLTGRPHDKSVQKATSDNENVDAVKRHALDTTRCGCSLTSCPGQETIIIFFSTTYQLLLYILKSNQSIFLVQDFVGLNRL